MKAFCSWSGGKDCCLALNRALERGYNVTHLISMFDESGERSRSHAISKELMQEQADSLGIELFIVRSSWQEYQTKYIESIKTLQTFGCEYGIFGNIDEEDYDGWLENMRNLTGIKTIIPLYNETRAGLIKEFFDKGFKSIVVCINGHYLPQNYCGKEYNHQFIDELPDNVDKCGENGEFHTFTFAGKCFKKKLDLRVKEIYHYKSNYSMGNEKVKEYYYAKLSLN